MLCQGQRGIIEIDFANTRPVHVPRAPVRVRRARLDGLLRGRGLAADGSTSSGDRGAPAPRSTAPARWRLWALVPIVLLVAVVSLFAARGGSLLELVGENPPPADAFDVRRVEFSPGEIRIRVTNPQREDLTIATVTVDDAIVPFTRRRPGRRSGGCARRRSSSRTPGSRTSRSPSASPARPGIQTTQARSRPRSRPRRPSADGLPRLRPHRRARRHRAGRPRPALAPVAPARAARVAGGVHGPDRRAAHLPRRRGARRGARAPGRAARRARRDRAWSCSASPRATSRSRSSRSASARAGGASRAARSSGLALATLVADRHRRPQPRRGPGGRARRSRSES